MLDGAIARATRNHSETDSTFGRPAPSSLICPPRPLSTFSAVGDGRDTHTCAYNLTRSQHTLPSSYTLLYHAGPRAVTHMNGEPAAFVTLKSPVGAVATKLTRSGR